MKVFPHTNITKAFHLIPASNASMEFVQQENVHIRFMYNSTPLPTAS